MRETKTVLFDKMKDGIPYGKYNGRPVYQHRDYVRDDVTLNSLWICEIEQYGLTSAYFATPIKEVSVGDVLKIDRENANIVAEWLIKNHGEAVARILEKTGRISDSERTDAESQEMFGDSILYCGDDTLQSPRFDSCSYDICTSMDNSVLMIIPRSTGRISCSQNKIRAEGLDAILGSRKGEYFDFEEYDGFLLINLKAKARA